MFYCMVKDTHGLCSRLSSCSSIATLLIFVLCSFQICCMCFPFPLFLNTLIDAHPFFVLKFICCQFAACLFFGISLIKYFLFSPLSPWLLTLLPTLTIVCCGKFLLVDFFFFAFFSLPFLFFVLFCENPNLILATSYANSRIQPLCHRKSRIANYKPVSWVWHQCNSETLTILSDGF